MARSTALIALPLVATLALAALAPNASADDGALLPDLDQEAPGQLQVAPSGNRADREWWLGFSSAVSNIGDGPFVIDGHRADRRTPKMTADQLVTGGADTADVVPDVGGLRYVTSRDHNHWHLLNFERYELRRAGGERMLVRDRKSGFCLGDRYRVAGDPPPGAPEDPAYTSRCGLGRPGLLQLTEGISVGYGDVYSPYLEFQQLPLDGLRSGRYVLVHRVNLKERLQESSLANNTASVLLELRWRKDRPRLQLLRSCPDTDQCDDPGPGSSKAGSQRSRVPVRTAPARRAAGLERGARSVCTLPAR